MRDFFFWVFMILGVVLGVWMGIGVMLVGGIVQIIDGIKATPTNSWWIAFGITRIACSSIVGWLTWLFCVLIGIALD